MFVPFDIDQKNPGSGYYVAQTCPELADTDHIPIILTHHYSIVPARRHLKAVRSDKYAAIIYIRHKPHIAQLHAACKSEKYRFYSAELTDEGVQTILQTYNTQIELYATYHEGWPAAEVQTEAVLSNGLLYLHLTYIGCAVHIKLNDVKKYQVRQPGEFNPDPVVVFGN